MKTLKLATLFTIGFFTGHAQNIRTFNNLDISTSLSKNTYQYAVFWGESVQFKSPVPLRFTTGLRLALNNKTTGLYPTAEDSPLSTLRFTKRPWYTTLALPAGVELYFKGIGIGAFQEMLSFSGKKGFKESHTPLGKEEKLRTQGFSGIFSKKQNLTGGVYLICTFNDSFSLKAGWNRISTTFTKVNATQDVGWARLNDDTFSVGIRLNIEK